jgi:asparagine N-glycosylation enzyme membrane subunit Stt3
MQKRWDVLAVCGLIAFAVLLRCLRLFDSSTYYVYNPDSHFFHWLAQRVMAGEGIPIGTSGVNYTIHSGFAYPAAYMAKALGFVFHLSSIDSLELVWKFLPTAISVISLVVLYFAVAKILGRRVAVFSVLTGALLFNSLFMGVAGNLDRDALTVLLLTVGVMLFYLSRSWRFTIAKRDLGWIVAGFSVLLVQVLLYLEWDLLGAMMLLAIISVYSVLKLLLEYSALLEKEPNLIRRVTIALRRSDLRAFVLVAAINLAAAGVLYSYQSTATLDTIVNIFKGRFLGNVSSVSEGQGLSVRDLIGFQFFLIPIGIGIYLAWKQRNDAMVLFASWFVSFLVLSLFSYRVIVDTVPAACVVSGVGLASIWGAMSSKNTRDIWKQLGILVMVILLVLISSVSAASLNRNNYILAADKNWREALTYLRDSTPQDAVVMSQWSYGYWVLDVAQREPFIDNGYYAYTIPQLRDVGLAYSTSDTSEAAAIMAKNGATYLVFGVQDLDLASSIMGWAGLNNKQDSFPDESLIVRSLNGDFLSGDGLELVYKNSEVVILAFTQPGQT